MRYGTLIALTILTAQAQTQIDLRTQAKSVDFSGASSTKPLKTGTALPSSCGTGEVFFNILAPTGANIFACTAPNTWTVQGGGGSSLAVEGNGALVGNRSSINLIAGEGIQDVLSDTGSQINVQTGLDTAVVQTQPGAQSGSALLCLSIGGHQNNYQCAMQPTLGAYNSGMVLHWVPDVNGAGGATTLNIDTLGTAPLKMADGLTDPGSTDIVGSRLYSIWYDGMAFRLVAAPSQGSGTSCPNGAPAGSVCAVKLYGDGSALTGIATPGTSPVVVSFNTATSTCSIISGGGTCTASPVAGASGGPGVIITHNFGKYVEWPVCNQGMDGSGAILGSSGAATSVTDVSPVNINATAITFSGATAAQCGISTGSMGPQGPNGPGYAATSTTSLAIAAGAQTFITLSGLAYSGGARARASSAANGANYMEGLITSYSGTSLVLNVDTTGGSGTYADWNLNLAIGLPSPITVRTYNTAAYTGIAPSTPVPLTFDTNDYDTNGIHSTTTNSSRFVAPSAGYYRFTCAIDTAANPGSQLVQFRLNGSTVVSCGGNSCSFYDSGTYEYKPWSMELHLNANDYLECLYAPSSGTVTPVAGKYHTNATFTQIH